jgi:MFS family permease
MSVQKIGIYQHNLPVFYWVDILRALWFMSSIWVLFERQYLTLPQLTFVEATITGVTLLMQLPTGAFADLFGKKIAMVIGCLCYSLSIYIYSYSTTFSMFLVYAVAMGVAGSFIDGTREALLYDSLKQDNLEHQFSKASSKLSLIFQIALALSILIGGWIGSFSYMYAIWLTAFAMFAAALVSYFFVEPIIDTEKFTIQNFIHKTKCGMRELFKNSYTKKISLYYIVIGSLTWICVFSLNMILLTELKYSTSEIGIVVGIGRIVMSVLLFKLIHIGSFLTRKRIFTLLPIILICTYVPAIFMTKWWALVPVMGAILVSGARWNILAHYTNREFDSRNRATAISTLTMVIGIVYVCVMSVSGVIMEKFGGVRVIYSLLGLVTVCTALPLGMYLSRQHKS